MIVNSSQRSRKERQSLSFSAFILSFVCILLSLSLSLCDTRSRRRYEPQGNGEDWQSQSFSVFFPLFVSLSLSLFVFVLHIIKRTAPTPGKCRREVQSGETDLLTVLKVHQGKVINVQIIFQYPITKISKIYFPISKSYSTFCKQYHQ